MELYREDLWRMYFLDQSLEGGDGHELVKRIGGWGQGYW